MQRRCTGRSVAHLSETMTSRLKTRFLVTAAALDGVGSTLQPLFRLCSVIYELSGNSLILSVPAAGLISVVMSWFPDFWSFSAQALEQSLEQVHMKMLWFFETSSSSFFFPLGSLCYPVGFVCAAGKLCGITSTPRLPRSKSELETVFLDFELPPCSQ